jgi:hypothetical protein
MPPATHPPPARASRSERLAALALAAAILAVFLIAWRLDPDPGGLGTHSQLGLTPCGFRAAFGRPCVTCGMTTSFALAADARFLDAARAQPVGLLIALLASAVFWAALHIAATGSRLAACALRITNGRALLIAAIILAAGWAYKILTTPHTPGLLW